MPARRWRPEASLEEVLRLPLPRPTASSKTEAGELAAELARVRELGYGVDDEESGAGVRCVGAPVRDARGAVVAAVSVSGPADRIGRTRVGEIAPAVIDTADEIAHRIGWAQH